MSNIKYQDLFDLMQTSGLHGAVKDFIAHFVEHVGSHDVKQKLLATPDEVYWSYNDSYLIYRTDNGEGFIEIADPYVKEGFAFFDPETFFDVLSNLMKGAVVESVLLLAKGVEDRHDFELSQDYW